MNINSITNINFNARKVPTQFANRTVKFVVPGKNNARVISTIYADNNHVKILDYQVRRCNKVVESGSFQNKKGFNEAGLTSVCKRIQECVKDGIDYTAEFFNTLFINKI